MTDRLDPRLTEWNFQDRRAAHVEKMIDTHAHWSGKGEDLEMPRSTTAWPNGSRSSRPFRKRRRRNSWTGSSTATPRPGWSGSAPGGANRLPRAPVDGHPTLPVYNTAVCKHPPHNT